MTVVSAIIRGQLRYARTPSEVEALIAEALAPGGGVAQWYVAEQEATDGDDGRPFFYPDVRLLTSVGEDGVSAAVSYLAPATEQHPDGILADSLAERPDAELAEQLLFNEDSQSTFPAGAAVPVEAVRQAVREYCRTGGAQPRAVQWQPGQYI